MTGRRRLFIGLSCILALTGWAADPVTNQTRIWTGKSGSTVTAELVRVQGNTLTLRTATGELMAIDLGKLSKADQEWVATNAPASASATSVAVQPPSRPKCLPVFADGDAKGDNAVYAHPHFDARVQINGLLALHLKDNGQQVGQPIQFSPQFYYARPDTGRFDVRTIIRFTSTNPPTRKPTTVKLAGTLTDAVKFEFEFEFRENTIAIWCRAMDPPDIKLPTATANVAVFVPRLGGLSEDPGLEEIRRAAGRSTVEVDPVSGRSITYPYVSGIEEAGQPLKQAVISPDAFGPRRITFVADTPRKSPLILTPLYPGYAPWRGFYLTLQKREHIDSENRTTRLTITIE